MSKKVSIGTVIVIAFLTALITFEITFVTVRRSDQSLLDEAVPAMDAYDKLTQVDAYYREYYVGEIDEEELMDGIIDGYIYGTGDKYAYYLDREEFAAAMQENSGEMVGIGVQVIYSEGLIEVVMVMPDSPALEAGVMPGDFIVTVEGESVAEIGYYAAIDKMLGDEGTAVTFSVSRDGELINYSINRKKIDAVSVMSHVLESDPTVGVVKILQFDLGTPDQFISACEELMAQGVTRFIFDVRYNPGGDLTSICAILDYLLPKGPIIRIVDNAENWEAEYSDAEHLDVPMCVLVNENTASAGELFSSALQDYSKEGLIDAKLVGTVTYGKGTMQSVIQLSDGSGFGISTNMYYPPFSDCYEGVGVVPDYSCEMDESLANVNIYKIADADDTQLQMAVEVLDSMTGAE